jgi:HEAT repeat protein
MSLGELRCKEAVPTLLAALDDSDPFVQKSAAEALGEIDDPRGLEPLLKLLDLRRKVSWQVRGAAARALARLKSPRAVPSLVRALNHPDDHVQTCAAEALGRMKARAAVTALCLALLDEKNHSAHSRGAVAIALGRIGDAEAVPYLIKALEDSQVYVQRRAVEALAMLKDARAVGPLVDLLKKSSQSKPALAEACGGALEKIVGPSWRELLR